MEKCFEFKNKTYYILIACLPNESKEILSRSGITILTPTPKPPIFDYASFCKRLSISQVHSKLRRFLKKQLSFSPQILIEKADILTQEILKLFVEQIPSLKKLVTFLHPCTLYVYFTS